MTAIFQDVRVAVRTMLRTPALSLAALVALALTVGANTAIFSVVDAVLFRPLPYHRPDTIVTAFESWQDKGFPQLGVLPSDYAEWRRQSTSFDQLAASWAVDVNLTGTGDAERIHGARVSSSLFPALGVPPAFGRGFAEVEDRSGAPRSAILSDGLWRRRFGASRNVLGRTIEVDGQPCTIVGVMPRGFTFSVDWKLTGLSTTPVELWLPLALRPEEADNGFDLTVVGRLKPGVTVAQADDDLKRIDRRLGDQEPVRRGVGAAVTALHDLLTREIRPAVLALAAAVGLVLLVTCANVASLLLARASSRRREMAIRAALGAGRLRVLRQLAVEGLVLAGGAGVLGLGLALAGTRLLAIYAPPAALHAGPIEVNPRVLAFMLAVTACSGVACAMAPAASVWRAGLDAILRQAGRGASAGLAAVRVQRWLVVTEIALALVLVVGSGLLINSFVRLVSIDPGFSPRGLASLHLSLPGSRYPTGERQVAFYADLLARARSLPEIAEIGAVSEPPLASGREVFYTVEGEPAADERQAPVATSRAVAGDYFRVAGIALRRGRLLTEADNASAPRVAVVDESFARRHWPGGDAIGRRVREGTTAANKPWLTVVGVVGSVRQYGLAADAKPGMYVPFLQSPRREMTLLVRARSAGMTVAPAVRGVVAQIDRDQPVDRVQTMDEAIGTTLAPQRFSASLLTGFAALALLLAAVGVYGLMSYTVAARTREIGVRVALGAQPRQVLRLVLRQGFALAGAGLALGCAAALATTRLLASQLYGVASTDAPTFAVACVVLLGAALLACYVPARRASRIDPVLTLRQD